MFNMLKISEETSSGVEVPETLMYFNLGQVMEIEISIPIWWMFLAFPVGFLILALTSLELIFDNIRNLINK